MAAAKQDVWTGAQLRRLLAERAGLELSAASISALLTSQPSQIKLSTLAALCTALDCTPNDLIEVQPAAAAGASDDPAPAVAQVVAAPGSAPSRRRPRPPG